jgi:hypothetical protein
MKVLIPLGILLIAPGGCRRPHCLQDEARSSRSAMKPR